MRGHLTIMKDGLLGDSFVGIGGGWITRIGIDITTGKVGAKDTEPQTTPFG